MSNCTVLWSTLSQHRQIIWHAIFVTFSLGYRSTVCIWVVLVCEVFPYMGIHISVFVSYYYRTDSKQLAIVSNRYLQVCLIVAGNNFLFLNQHPTPYSCGLCRQILGNYDYHLYDTFEGDTVS